MNPEDKPAASERRRSALTPRAPRPHDGRCRGQACAGGPRSLARAGQDRRRVARATAPPWSLRSKHRCPPGPLSGSPVPTGDGVGVWRRLGVAGTGVIDTAGTEAKALVETRPVFADRPHPGP